jgi:hypothetical protein
MEDLRIEGSSYGAAHGRTITACEKYGWVKWVTGSDRYRLARAGLEALCANPEYPREIPDGLPESFTTIIEPLGRVVLKRDGDSYRIEQIFNQGWINWNGWHIYAEDLDVKLTVNVAFKQEAEEAAV